MPTPGVLMLDIHGTVLSAEDIELLQHPHVGGVILFSRNIGEPEQVLELTSAIRRQRPEILLAVDQEGGRVQRLRDGFTRLPPMLMFGHQWRKQPEHTVRLVHDCGWLMASEVLAAGFDFSFAPVLDLYTGLSEVIGNRAFSDDKEVLISLASAFMSGMHEAGMATTGKHFPGHGSVEADSHLALPVDNRPLQQIRDEDLLPFVRCLPLLDAVMPAHVIYSQADAHCAGFSRFWLQTVLRQECGFDGVIFSDDLVMEAASSAGTMSQRVEQALSAGCDMLLVCNKREAARDALATLTVLADEPLLAQQIQQSSLRLARMRRRDFPKGLAQCGPQWGDLQQSSRWRSVHQELVQLMAHHTL